MTASPLGSGQAAAPGGTPAVRTGAELLALARPWRARLLLVAAAVLAAALLALVPPLIVRHVIDHTLTPHRTAGLAVAALGYLAVTAAAAVLTAGYGYLAATVAQRSLAGLRTRLFSHLLRLPAGYHDQTPAGDSISRCTADVEAIDDLFSSSVATLLGQTAQLVTVAVTMLILSPPLTAAAAVFLPPVALFTNYLRRRIRDAERGTRAAVGLLNTRLQEDLSGAEVIRAFGRQAMFTDRFRLALTGWLRATNRATFYNAFYAPGLGVASAAATALLLWLGGRGTFAAFGVSLGTLTAFVLLFAQFISPLINLGDEWQSVQGALSGAERVFSVLALPAGDPPGPAPAAPQSPHTIPAPRKDLTVDRATFGYAPGVPVLHDVSLTVRPGEHVVVVGRTGAGKTSLLALLAGLYPPWTGHVRVAGHDPRTLEDAARRAVLGFVPQTVQLFSGTVQDNLTLGDDTITAVIDGASDAAFRGALREHVLASGTAVLTVAHRLATARDANRVLVMAAGRIIEEGTPGDLLAAGGPFAAMAALEDAGWDWEQDPAEAVQETPA